MKGVWSFPNIIKGKGFTIKFMQKAKPKHDIQFGTLQKTNVVVQLLDAFGTMNQAAEKSADRQFSKLIKDWSSIVGMNYTR